MLLNEISALRAGIFIAFAKTPEKESVYVGNITLEKDGRKFQFDWNEHSGEYTDKTHHILLLLCCAALAV